MNGKIITTGTHAREQMLHGINILADAVKVTLGPAGRNVIIERANGDPVITKDGVSVAKEVTLTDRHLNLGAQVVKQVSSRANEEAGDGTTTATVLAQNLIQLGHKAIAAGMNPIELKRGMDRAHRDAIKIIANSSVKCDTTGMVRNVANISGNSDQEVADIVTKAYESLDFETAAITVNETTNTETTLEVLKGLSHNEGYVSPAFINVKKSNCWKATDPAIIVLNDDSPNVEKLMAILSAVADKEIMLIAPTMQNEVPTVLGQLAMQSKLRICLVHAPSFGVARENYLEDIAIFTGGKVIGGKNGIPLEEAKHDHVGTAAAVTVGKKNFIIAGHGGTSEDINERIQQIDAMRKDVNQSSFDYNRLAERIAKLSSGVAIIHVGGYSKVEVKEKRDRIDDALSAVSAAVEEGIVAGGGATLVHVAKLLKMQSKDIAGDQAVGYDMVLSAMGSPLRQIVTNAGGFGDVVFSRVEESDNINLGYDAATETYGNMLELGIIDPAKVTRCALDFSVSVAGMVLTTETMICIDDDSYVKTNRLRTQ